jgi:hypothetical protein
MFPFFFVMPFLAFCREATICGSTVCNRDWHHIIPVLNTTHAAVGMDAAAFLAFHFKEAIE